MREHKVCAVPAYTHISPGSNRVKVMIINLTPSPITISKGENIAEIRAANAIPDLLIPASNQGEANAILEYAPQVCTLVGNTQEQSDELTHLESLTSEMDQTPLNSEQLQEFFEKLKLKENMEGWTKEQQYRAYKIITQYSFLFAMNSLDLGCTDLVKYHITLTDSIDAFLHTNMMRSETILKKR